MSNMEWASRRLTNMLGIMEDRVPKQRAPPAPLQVAIDESLQRTTAQAAAPQLAARSRLSAAGVRRSLPSWLHMPALGARRSCCTP